MRHTPQDSVSRVKLASLLFGRWVLYIALVLASGYALWRIPSLSFFHIQRVEVYGVRFVSSDSLVAALRVDSSRSIFMSLDSLTNRAASVPGIAAVLVRRRLPGTVVLSVLETVPVAWSSTGGVLQMVDEAAEPLPADPRGQHVRLPVAPADTAVTRALGRLLSLDAGWFGRVEQVSPGPRGTLEVLLAEGRVVLPRDPVAETILDLQMVLTDLAHRGESWEVIDASYPGRVFVRRRPSARAKVDTVLSVPELETEDVVLPFDMGVDSAAALPHPLS